MGYTLRAIGRGTPRGMPLAFGNRNRGIFPITFLSNVFVDPAKENGDDEQPG